ncbi:PDZ domain-containing protein 6 [Phytophthora infestans]|uniref:PDZ domain-containing protein 6 n=1 Tax=Phytophthora infestans TaxID=4787 RepID=A0A833WD26_PHYIN|nr:PDZ domain-containing protein 6 [Phytophthora infestans]
MVDIVGGRRGSDTFIWLCSELLRVSPSFPRVYPGQGATIATALNPAMAAGQHKTPVDGKSSVASSSPSSGGAQAFAPLPFDESLIASASATESATSTSITSTKSAADFFLDQIAAVVSDEKKLSDNIMDLIPPVEAPVSQAGTTQPMTSMSMPLQPPPGLMLRALSPPTSLLPDFGDVASLSLLGDATVATTATSSATATTVTTAVKRELPVVKPAVTGTVAMRRKAELATAASVTHKKQKTEPSKPDTVVKAAPVSVHQQIQQQARHLHNTSNALTAAAAAAREKVMKEPQSGDLYECVITKRNGGLGLTLACVDDHVQITGLAPDTPAASSGICVGDTLVAVSGLPVRGLQFSTVIGRLKSTSRNSVVLKLRRNPFRQNAGNSTAYRGIKRPGRGVIKGSESSNSANVLTSKTMALESRLGGGLGNGLNGSATNSLHNGNASAGLDELHRSHQAATSGFASSLHTLKAEPMNSTYFPTDASVLTMGATVSGSTSAAVPASALAPSSSLPSEASSGCRVGAEEKDRYYAECRALRHELGRAMVAQRAQKRDTDTYTTQLQAVVDKFQQQVDGLATDELATLRQKLVETNQTLAKQQTEILALQERETRHALPEAQRVKWQMVSRMRKSVLQIDCKAACKVVKKTASLSFKERIEGVRASAFVSLVGQSNVKSETSTIELDLDAKTCTELLGWNLRESVVQAGATYTVSVADTVHIKYTRAEEVLVVSWTLCVKDKK